jgi:hypothetical protein
MRVTLYNKITALLFMFLLIGSTGAVSDEILDFYISAADRAFSAWHPDSAGAVYSYRETAKYHRLDGDGRIIKTDSAVTDYFCSFGQLDSTNVIAIPTGKIRAIEYSYPDIFAADYDFSFFPNDTGGSDLAIGFDTKDSASQDPTGIAIIDRDRFFLKRLHTHYPNLVDYERLSRSFHFQEKLGVALVDSIIEVGSLRGVFSTEHYRLIVSRSDIQVQRP